MKLIEPRAVPLGGLRAMTVRRLLPSRDRRMVGAWCFIDHYGPDDVAVTGGMRVAPHPHTGLQTASWIFTGTVEHRDSLGTVADVRPGELNLMTAGYGINHSEYSTADTRVLHGVQLWVALPAEHLNTQPAFENFVPPPLMFAARQSQDGAASLPVQARVFLGDLGLTTGGATLHGSSPVKTFSPLLGAEILVGTPGSDPSAPKNPPADAPRQHLTLTLDPGFERGILVDAGTAIVQGCRIEADHMLYLEPGSDTLTIETVGDTRLIVLGGQPFGEHITMWWNFIGRNHQDIVDARAAWQTQVERFEPGTEQDAVTVSAVAEGATLETLAGEHPRFGGVVLLPAEYGESMPLISAPQLPPVTLKSRGD